MNNVEKNVRLEPHRFIGKYGSLVADRMKELNINHRIAHFNGLLTVDVDPERYTIIVDDDDIIVECYYG